MGQILNSGQLHSKPAPRLHQQWILSKDSQKSEISTIPSSLHVLVELEASRYLQQVPNCVSFLASKEHESILVGTFTPLSVLRPVSVSAVITHSQDISGSLLRSLKLFPDKIPVDAPSDYKKQQRHHTQAVEMCRSCTAHTRHCMWEGLIPAEVDKASTF